MSFDLITFRGEQGHLVAEHFSRPDHSREDFRVQARQSMEFDSANLPLRVNMEQNSSFCYSMKYFAVAGS